jgi:hypothetical protein
MKMKHPLYAVIGIIGLWLSLSLNFLNAALQKTVLFDEAHGQRFLIEGSGPLDLSGLSILFQGEGWRIKSSKQPITDDLLDGVDALVISGAFKPLTPHEISAITRFLDEGGRISVMLHIGPPMATLLHHLNVAISNGVVHEQEKLIHNKTLDFYVTQLKPHDLMKGLERFSVYGGWALLSTGKNSEIIAHTGPRSWIDLNRDGKLNRGDAVQSFGIVVAGTFGLGRFVVFGDDAIFQNQFLTEDNTLLGKNLVRWLGSSSKGNQKIH